MGQVLHPSAITTEAVRRAIQQSQESLRTLARRFGISLKTVFKPLRVRLNISWRTRNFARKLKALHGLTVYEFHCKCCQSVPERFSINPLH